MPRSSQDVHKKILGRAGEKAVAEYLRSLGYEILKTNYVTPFGEADIVAEDKKRGEIAFVEVKTRAADGLGSPEQAFTPAKRDRVVRPPKRWARKNGNAIGRLPLSTGCRRGRNRTRVSTWRKCGRGER